MLPFLLVVSAWRIGPVGLAQRHPVAPGAVGDDLGEHGDGRLLHGRGADVQPAGREDAVDLLVGHADVAQAAVAVRGRVAAAKRADVAGAGGERGLHGGDVELRVVGEDQHGVARAEFDAVEHRVGPADLGLGGGARSGGTPGTRERGSAIVTR